MRTLIVSIALLALCPMVFAEEFEDPIQIQAGGEPVAVEAPGFACPTLADVDGDGKRDLVVGQFSQGKMHFFKNTGTDTQPAFAKGDWIKTGDKPALVPDVW